MGNQCNYGAALLNQSGNDGRGSASWFVLHEAALQEYVLQDNALARIGLPQPGKQQQLKKTPFVVLYDDDEVAENVYDDLTREDSGERLVQLTIDIDSGIPSPIDDEAEPRSPPKVHKVWFSADDLPLIPMPAPEPDEAFPVSSYYISEAGSKLKYRTVNFAESPTHSVHRSEFSVPPYGEIYGVHPRYFDFDEDGGMHPKSQPRRLDFEETPRSFSLNGGDMYGSW